MQLRVLYLTLAAVLLTWGTGCSPPQSAFVTTAAMEPRPTGENVSLGATELAQRSDKRDHTFSGDFADPFVLRGARAYDECATGIAELNLQVAGSDDLVGWTPLGDALPELPAWAVQEHGLTWAPSALARQNRYVL